MVHVNSYVPAPAPEIELDAELGLSMVTDVPPVCVHVPVPDVGVFADRFTASPTQSTWSVPALDVVGSAVFVIVTSSSLLHEAFDTVHLNTYVPVPALLKDEVGLELSEKLPDAGPETLVHSPDSPPPGVFPDSEKLVCAQRF